MLKNNFWEMSNSSFEDKSPSPKPFKEPDNMFTIDLDKTEYYTNGK